MTQGAPGSERVLTDPQYGLVSVLRPYAAFEDVYNTVAGNVPIMFTEAGQILDSRAGKPGYSPHLVNALQVCMGARIQLWLPTAPANRLFGPYIWLLGWRLSNTHDFRGERRSYHYPRQGGGTPEGVHGGGDPGPRVVVPCAWEAIVVLSTGPRVMNKDTSSDFTASDYAIHQLCAEGVKVINNDFQFMGSSTTISPTQPLIDVGGLGIAHRGILQQGILDPYDAVNGDFGMPSYLTYDTRAKGDELLVACVKDQTPLSDSSWHPNWDLVSGGADWIFSTYFGQGGITAGAHGMPLPDVGVYVSIGVAP